jgi:short-subunit dehydrogenase
MSTEDAMAISLKPVNEQVIVITGASSGIGLATAEAAAKAGAKLVLAARSGDTLDEIAARLTREGAEVLTMDVDVADRLSMEALATAAIERFGRIDTWVNNAGVAIYGRLDQVTDEDSRRLFETNFWGVVNGSLVALRRLRSAGGAIINIGSEVSDAVVPLQGMYSASKHAVKGFTDALRIEVEELDKAPVAITLIQPTAVNTPYPEHAANYMDREPKLPSPQIEPSKVAEAILKAAANHSRDVTVGAMAKVNTTVAKIAPSLGDKMGAKLASKQQRDEPPSRDPAGGLYEGRGDGRTHGR